MNRDGREPDEALLGALRRAWRQLPAPDACRPLEQEDPATRRAVEWVREAWLALPVPAATAPRGAAHAAARARPGLLRRDRWRRFAAAAALLLALGVPLLVLALRRENGAAPVARTDDPPALDPVAAGPATTGPTPEASPRTIVAVGDSHLELRSGPVRLYLFTDPPFTPPRENPR